MKKYIGMTALLITALSLTSCAGGPDPSIDPAEATAQCGTLGRIIGGDVPITASNYEEVTDILETLADEGVGEVKSTAAFIVAGLDGEEQSDKDSEKAIDSFKDFCLNYTVD